MFCIDLLTLLLEFKDGVGEVGEDLSDERVPPLGQCGQAPHELLRGVCDGRPVCRLVHHLGLRQLQHQLLLCHCCQCLLSCSVCHMLTSQEFLWGSALPIHAEDKLPAGRRLTGLHCSPRQPSSQ